MLGDISILKPSPICTESVHGLTGCSVKNKGKLCTECHTPIVLEKRPMHHMYVVRSS
jgi:hypothetical protein